MKKENIFYFLEGLDDLSYNKVKDYITDLQMDIDQSQEIMAELTKENERLNNIINELGRSIYYKARYFRDVKEPKKAEICLDIFNKLQELKGDK